MGKDNELQNTPHHLKRTFSFLALGLQSKLAFPPPETRHTTSAGHLNPLRSTSPFNMAEGLSTLEAEELVKKLQPWEVRDVGTQTWIAQHSAIERLNMQAHFSAQRNSDEFVVEELQTYEKVWQI